MNVQFTYTILYVKDVAENLLFYSTVFGFKQKMLTAEKDYGELDTGSTTLAFANLDLGTSNFKDGFDKSSLDQKPFGIELAFTTNEVEEVIEKAISNGAINLAEAVTKPWGQKVGYVRDLNGFIIEICSSIEV